MENHFIRNSTRCFKRSLSIDELIPSHKQSRLSNSIHFLTDKNFNEFHRASKTISRYLQYENQRLASPYYKYKINHDNHLLLPLRTNEYFIRNGLLNHNDRPEIFASQYFNRSDLHSCSSSQMIVSPLRLFSNQKHLFTALTSNFKMNEYDGNQSETKSVLLRKHKVQTWEKDFNLYSTFEQSDESNYCLNSLETFNRKDGNNQLFPMMKILAPIIILSNFSRVHTMDKNYR